MDANIPTSMKQYVMNGACAMNDASLRLAHVIAPAV
jgi:hypothetical protein